MSENIIGIVISFCGSILTAAATLAAAFISKLKFSDDPNPEPKKPIIVQPIDKFEIKENTSIIEPITETTIAIHDVILDDRVNFDYTPLHQFESIKVKNAKVGWKGQINHDGCEYALTVLHINGRNKSVLFDFRKINKPVSAASEKTTSVVREDKPDDGNDGSHTENLPRRGLVVNCPNCGASLPINENLNKCQYCGSNFI